MGSCVCYLVSFILKKHVDFIDKGTLFYQPKRLFIVILIQLEKRIMLFIICTSFERTFLKIGALKMR